MEEKGRVHMQARVPEIRICQCKKDLNISACVCENVLYSSIIIMNHDII